MTTTQSAPNTGLFYPAPTASTGLMGLPHLMEMAFRGVNLAAPTQALIERAGQHADDANALMDLACIMHLTGQDELAQRIQADALSLSRLYTLPAQGESRLRVLSVMAPGALMDNAPIEFLLHGSHTTLDMLYVDPTADLSQLRLPPHDVACIGVCESDAARPVLQALSRVVGQWPRPVLNDPAHILTLARDQAWRLLQGAPGCAMPASVSVDRDTLLALGRGELALHRLLPDGHYPLICRPRGSHAGKGLAKLDDAAAVAQYAQAAQAEQGQEGAHFYLSSFIDYIGPDQQYRKYRIAFVGGKAYPVHLALSARWMVHYLNGDMVDRPDNRAQEQHFFDHFEQDFAQRHAAALAAIDERVRLDCFSIDCGELPDGRLLVFEMDTGGVVHAMDPLEDFGYKRPHMLRCFAAFQALLSQAAQDPRCLKCAPTPA